MSVDNFLCQVSHHEEPEKANEASNASDGTESVKDRHRSKGEFLKRIGCVF